MSGSQYPAGRRPPPGYTDPNRDPRIAQGQGQEPRRQSQQPRDGGQYLATPYNVQSAGYQPPLPPSLRTAPMQSSMPVPPNQWPPPNQPPPFPLGAPMQRMSMQNAAYPPAVPQGYVPPPNMPFGMPHNPSAGIAPVEGQQYPALQGGYPSAGPHQVPGHQAFESGMPRVYVPAPLHPTPSSSVRYPPVDPSALAYSMQTLAIDSAHGPVSAPSTQQPVYSGVPPTAGIEHRPPYPDHASALHSNQLQRQGQAFATPWTGMSSSGIQNTGSTAAATLPTQQHRDRAYNSTTIPPPHSAHAIQTSLSTGRRRTFQQPGGDIPLWRVMEVAPPGMDPPPWVASKKDGPLPPMDEPNGFFAQSEFAWGSMHIAVFQDLKYLPASTSKPSQAPSTKMRQCFTTWYIRDEPCMYIAPITSASKTDVNNQDKFKQLAQDPGPT
ncbi:hypothetical protein OH77DRAFT_268690 [Trametes cingulata]|nr:hypothetical protein OH77DRAFT_268690 [Trametes cingulata]